MSNNSDYKKTRLDIFDLMPETQKSDTARSFFENTTNRHLTKTDMTKVIGIIGEKDQTAQVDLRIDEENQHREAFQLQPLVRAKVATVEHVMSYIDLLKQLEQLGIDNTRLPKWGNALGFNFAPPLSIDKIINYRDYFWYDPSDPTSTPQYITIENYLTTAEARLEQKQNEITSVGLQHSISGVSIAPNAFYVAEDLTYLKPDAQFQIVSSAFNDGIWTVTNVEFVGGQTIITVLEPVNATVIDGILTFANQIAALSDDVNCLSGLTPGPCVVEQVANDWTTDNKWVHRSDLTSALVSLARRAEMPILEYHPGLQLNEWSYTRNRWYYRTSPAEQFQSVDNEPTDSDLTDPDFLQKWVLISTDNPVPIDPQVENTTPVVASLTGATLTTGDFLTYTLGTGIGVALAGDDAIRVYVDGIRQYGSYTENADGNGFVDSIVFNSSQASATEIEVYVSSSADADKNRNAIEVRTILDDLDYQLAVTATTQPVRRSLIRYRKIEQVKSKGEIKYPLFDLFLVDGTTANRATPIFSFVEDSTALLNTLVNQRVKTDTGSRNYYFQQEVLDGDNSIIYAFKDSSSISVDNPTGLQTIWRKGTNNEEYIPQQVDGDRQPVTIGEGEWEIPNQLFFNSSHNNRKELTSADLATHVNTILADQPVDPIFFQPDNFSHRLTYDLNYGVGGTIKEYNDSYDLFVSSIFANNTNPIMVINFAQQQYESIQNTIKESLSKSMIDYLANDSADFMNDRSQSIASDVIQKYELNDSASLLYGDSTTYDSTTGLGVENWIATLPFIKMILAEQPVILTDEKRGISELLHHDSHKNAIQFLEREINGFKKNIIKQEVSTGRLRGWTDTIPADGGTPTTRAAVDWQRLLKNDYWLEGNDLYRFNVVSISTSQPSSSFKDGSYWLNSATGEMYIRDEGNPLFWIPTGAAPNDVSEGWQLVDFDQLVLEVFLEIEDRLYQASPSISNVAFDPSEYILDAADQTFLDLQLEQEFNDYVRTRSILQPYLGDFNISDPFTWNYKTVVYDGGITVFKPNVASAAAWGARWHSINEAVFNTPYPHLEPWKLQLYREKPTWWDEEYKDLTGSRRWMSTMWTAIQGGTIPAGKALPVGVTTLPTYSFVSVNTSSTTYSVYDPDDLLPPFDGNLIGTPIESQMFIRNITAIPFGDIDNEYVFGDQGPVEWEWRKSTSYLYSNLKIAFKLQPVRFIHTLWGNGFYDVASLQVDTDLQKVLSHKDVIFHGDLIDNVVYKSPGLNQWYVNFNRYNNYDNKNSDFRELWTTWNAELSYQCGGFIDPRSFKGFTQNFNLTEDDRSIIVKKTPAASDYWIDSITVTVSQFGESKLRNNVKVPKTTGFDWEFLINSPVGTTRTVEYYPTKNFIFNVTDANAGLCELQSDILPWETGQAIIVKSTDQLPILLTPDPIITHQAEMQPIENNSQLFIIAISTTEFKLARTAEDALAGIYLEFYDTGIGTLRVAELNSTFFAYGGENAQLSWDHYALDKDRLLTTLLPFTITGLQQVVDFIDGYSAKLEDTGFIFNNNQQREQDPNTGRLVNWQTEIERLIDIVYTGLGVNNALRSTQGQVFDFTANATNDFLTTNLNTDTVNDGDTVYLYSTGILPAPLQANTAYYIVNKDVGLNGQFQLATTLENALLNVPINITTTGTGLHKVGFFDTATIEAVRTVEVNPFRNNLWFTPKTGIVSNALKGPYEDITVSQTLFDQYGRPFEPKDILFLREDKLTNFRITSEMVNDVVSNVNRITGEIDEYNYIHVGGMHLFVDEYEHIIVFNSYSVGDYLIYDEFLGLKTPRFNVQFDRQSELTKRHSVGGFFLNNNDLIRNIETGVSDMQLYYDTNVVSEASPFISYARDLLGFENPQFLDRISATEKTKFLFWKGMIQQKGSINAVNAFINSIKFEDAKIDEYWAYRIAEYGDIDQKIYPEVNLFTTDTRRSNIRFHFTNQDDTVVEPTFDEITFQQEPRWSNLPDLLTSVSPDDNILFDAEITQVQQVNIPNPLATDLLVELDVIADSVRISSPTVANVDFANQFLVEGTHYTQINSHVIEFDATEITNFLTANGLTQETFNVYIINPAYSLLNPSKIIDDLSKTIITNVPVWDPARRYNSFDAIRDVDVQHFGDPFRFPTNTLPSPEHNWTVTNKNTTWLDLSTIGYRPYYDSRIMANADEQIGEWGTISDWANINVFEWIESTVPPSEYDQLVAQQEGDITLSEETRASGTPRQPLWKYNRDVFTINSFSVGLSVINITANPLPSDLVAGSEVIVRFSPQNDGKYTVASVNSLSPSQHELIVEEPLTSSSLSGDEIVSHQWRLVEPDELHVSFYEGIRGIHETSYTLDDNAFVKVYYDGLYSNEGNVDDTELAPTYASLVSTSVGTRVDIIEEPTEDQISLGLYKFDYDFITKDVINPSSKELEQRYYFWVADKALRTNDRTYSPREIERRLTVFDHPHQFFRSLQKTEDSVANVRDHYTQIIIRRVTDLVDADERYILRLTNDKTLRDSKIRNVLSEKNKHEEWQLFRQEQPESIPRFLWDKLTEAAVGFELTEFEQGNLVPVPALDRVLYDQVNGTDTRFGIRTGQILITSDRAVDIVVTTIKQESFDPYPIDKFQFFETNTFDTPENIKTSMEFIFNNFPSTSTNELFFAVLKEALANKQEFPDILKTSMIALHGIKVLQTGSI